MRVELLIRALRLFFRAGFELAYAFKLLVAKRVGEIKQGYRDVKGNAHPVFKARRVHPGNDPVGVEDVLHAQLCFPLLAQRLLQRRQVSPARAIAPLPQCPAYAGCPTVRPFSPCPARNCL